MLTTLRAVVAVTMMLGFYALILAVTGGLGWLAYLTIAAGHGVWGTVIGIVALLVAASVVVATARVLRARPETPSGLPLSREQAPELWSTVTDLARGLRTRLPDQVLLVPAPNAAVAEDARLLGLLGGRRTLFVGVPLLEGLTVAGLRSVLAHELAHYSRSHTRLGPVVYRARAAVLGTVLNLSGPAGWLFGLYASAYLLVEAAVSRRQELEADVAAVRVAGQSTAQAALLEVAFLEAAWEYFGRCTKPGWDAGYAPDDVFGGFGELLRSGSVELARLRAEPPPPEWSRWDSHPPIATRIEAMAAVADDHPPDDPRPASVLVRDLPQAYAALVRSALELGDRTVQSWDEFAAHDANATAQARAGAIYRAVARCTDGRASLDAVLELAEAGRLGAVGGPLTETPGEALELLVGLAALGSGKARWRHSWADGPTLARPDGSPFDVREIARLAADPALVSTARARLASLGIETAEAEPAVRASAWPGEVLGGLSNMKVHGKPHDVLILHSGLIIIPCERSTTGGRQRLKAMADWGALERLARDNEFVAYEDITSVTITRGANLRAEIGLRDGRSLTLQEAWMGESIAKDDLDTLVVALRSRLPHFGARPASSRA